MQVQNGTEPGVRRSKRPRLASGANCKCPMETSLWKVSYLNQFMIRLMFVTGIYTDQSLDTGSDGGNPRKLNLVKYWSRKPMDPNSNFSYLYLHLRHVVNAVDCILYLSVFTVIKQRVVCLPFLDLCHRLKESRLVIRGDEDKGLYTMPLGVYSNQIVCRPLVSSGSSSPTEGVPTNNQRGRGSGLYTIPLGVYSNRTVCCLLASSGSSSPPAPRGQTQSPWWQRPSWWWCWALWSLSCIFSRSAP